MCFLFLLISHSNQYYTMLLTLQFVQRRNVDEYIPPFQARNKPYNPVQNSPLHMDKPYLHTASLVFAYYP